MEIHKILDRINKYLSGNIADIGCGEGTVIPGAYGIDGRDFPCVSYRTDNLYGLPAQLPDKLESFDCVVSSHTLEHLPDSYRAIFEWRCFCKKGGYFILYLPDGKYYDNFENQEHFHDFTYSQFVFWFKRAFCGEAKNFKGQQYSEALFELIESGVDYGENRYSFYIVAKRIK